MERLTDFSAQRIIQKLESDVGVEEFIGHSLRVGSVVALARASASVVEMQIADRWKSSQMPVHYAKSELAKQEQSRNTKRNRLDNCPAVCCDTLTME